MSRPRTRWAIWTAVAPDAVRTFRMNTMPLVCQTAPLQRLDLHKHSSNPKNPSKWHDTGQISDLDNRQAAYHNYREELDELDVDHIEFTPYLWHTLVDHDEVSVDATITFTFRDGSSVPR